jgi:hypothetical protein
VLRSCTRASCDNALDHHLERLFLDSMSWDRPGLASHGSPARWDIRPAASAKM